MVIEWIRGWYRPIVFNCSFVTLNIFLFSSVLIRVFQRNRTMYFHMRSFMIGIGSCSYGDYKVLSLLSASWRTRKAGNSIQSSQAWESRVVVTSQVESIFTLPLPFCAIQALIRLHDVQLHWWGQSLLSLLIQMLISPRDLFTNTTTKNVLPAIWTSVSQSSWYIKLIITVNQGNSRLI